MFLSHILPMITYFKFSEFHLQIRLFTAGTVLQSGGSTWSNNLTHLMNISVFLAAKQDLEIFPDYQTHSLKKHVSNESKKQVS